MCWLSWLLKMFLGVCVVQVGYVVDVVGLWLSMGVLSCQVYSGSWDCLGCFCFYGLRVPVVDVLRCLESLWLFRLFRLFSGETTAGCELCVFFLRLGSFVSWAASWHRSMWVLITTQHNTKQHTQSTAQLSGTPHNTTKQPHNDDTQLFLSKQKQCSSDTLQRESDTSQHFFLRAQAHFILSGTRLARQETAEVHALCVVSCCVLFCVCVCVFVFVVVWCVCGARRVAVCVHTVTCALFCCWAVCSPSRVIGDLSAHLWPV